MILYTVKNGVYYNLEDFRQDLSRSGRKRISQQNLYQYDQSLLLRMYILSAKPEGV